MYCFIQINQTKTAINENALLCLVFIEIYCILRLGISEEKTLSFCITLNTSIIRLSERDHGF